VLGKVAKAEHHSQSVQAVDGEVALALLYAHELARVDLDQASRLP
jgi:hypothetical protein